MTKDGLMAAMVFVYPTILIAVSWWRSRGVKKSEDFMVAGRSVPALLLVGTLVCTWIGSGSLFGGAGLAYRTGLAALWFSVGAWTALVVACFLAGRVRRIAQFTLPDLLEKRYNAAARMLGTLTIILAWIAIAAYQFRGGGWILAIVTDGRIPVETGIFVTALIVVTVTILAGMSSVVAVDIFNGVVISVSLLFALPFMIFKSGGIGQILGSLPPSYLEPMGGHNFLWILGVSLPTFLLLLGDSGIYQKFFSARSEHAARRAALGMLVGVVILESSLALLAIVGRSAYPALPQSGTVQGLAGSETVILQVARNGLPALGGALLLAACVAIVLSTANSFMVVASSNFTRDVYHRFLAPGASERRLLLVQRLTIVVFAGLALLLLTQFETVLAMALYAYSLIGAGLTPAILAAFLWKRVTPQGGVACLAGGLLAIVGIGVASRLGVPFVLQIGGSAFDFAGSDYIVLPGLLASLTLLIAVSLLTPPSPPEKWQPFRPNKT